MLVRNGRGMVVEEERMKGNPEMAVVATTDICTLISFIATFKA